MSWIQRLFHSLRPQKLEEDLERELEFHLEMRTREKTAAGISRQDARREVLSRFGSIVRTKEACRDESTLAGLATLWQDLRYAGRNLRSHPAFTAGAVACLAIGIGANTAIFSFVNAFLFPTLPPRVVLVQRASGSPVSFPELQDWRRLDGAFDAMFGYSPGERLTIGIGTGSEYVLGETVTGDYFHTLNVLPSLGRLLAPEDEALPVAVLGYEFWRDRLAADPAISGKTIRINRRIFTIAGVAAPSFQGMLAPWSTQVWVTPYLHRDSLPDRRTASFYAGARLKNGINRQRAAAAVNQLDRELSRQFPDPQRRGRDPLAVTRRSGLSGSPVWGVFVAMAVLLMGVSAIIFLIACGNVAGLLIARAAARRREIAIRLSIGASRSRLIRQFLTEILLLSLLGGSAGVVLAFAAGDSMANLLPRSISGGFRFQHGIGFRVLAFTLAISLAGVVLSGLLPAFRASDPKFGRASRSPRLRPLLIVSQVAASVLALATAGIFVRDFQKAQAVGPGFDSGHLLTVKLDLRDLHAPAEQIAQVYRQLRAGVAALPEVASAALVDVLPLGDERSIAIPGEGRAGTASVDASYFRTMGIPLLRGREPRDDEHDVAVVNQALAGKLWPGEDPLGKTIRLRNDRLPLQVIGVTATGKYWSLDEAPRPFLYQVSNQWTDPVVCLAIRTQRPSGRLANSIAREMERWNPDLPPLQVQTEFERLRGWLQPKRSAAALLSVLGLAALGLAITGLYALLSQLVSQRTAEIAVRVALGATRASLIGMLLRYSGLLLVVGTAAGLAASLAATRVLATLSGGLTPLDGITIGCVALLPAVVGAVATVAPAYRAVRIHPALALSAE